jgi:short-subunit dehydrogenase
MRTYALITGAAGGLGRALAAECAAQGWDLFLTDISQERLDRLSAGLERLYGVEALTAACDLTDAEARERLWRSLESRGLRFHLLLNVAGLDYQGPFDERRPEELRTMVRLNVEATLEMTHRALSRRDPSRTFRIVNVSSLAAFYPMPVKAVYAASKRFLLDWSRALAEELRDQNVTVTALCPAGMPTTSDCIRSIDAQGLMGRLTTLDTGRVATRTVRAARAGRRLVIPGVANQALRLLGNLAPAGLVARLINRRWQEAHARAHGTPGSAQPVSATASAAAVGI